MPNTTTGNAGSGTAAAKDRDCRTQPDGDEGRMFEPRRGPARGRQTSSGSVRAVTLGVISMAAFWDAHGGQPAREGEDQGHHLRSRRSTEDRPGIGEKASRHPAASESSRVNVHRSVIEAHAGSQISTVHRLTAR